MMLFRYLKRGAPQTINRAYFRRHWQIDGVTPEIYSYATLRSPPLLQLYHSTYAAIGAW